jgi:ribonuclease P protein component
LGDVKPGLYIIVARPSAAKATFQSLQRDVRYLLKKQDALTEGSRAQ